MRMKDMVMLARVGSGNRDAEAEDGVRLMRRSRRLGDPGPCFGSRARRMLSTMELFGRITFTRAGATYPYHQVSTCFRRLAPPIPVSLPAGPLGESHVAPA